MLLGAVDAGMVGRIGIQSLLLPGEAAEAGGAGAVEERNGHPIQIWQRSGKGQCSSLTVPKQGRLLPSSLVRTSSISVPFIGEIPPFHRIHIPSVAFATTIS